MCRICLISSQKPTGSCSDKCSETLHALLASTSLCAFDRSAKCLPGLPRRFLLMVWIVLSGFLGEDSTTERFRNEGVAQRLYCSWSKKFLEAGGKRLACKTARQVNSAEVKDLRDAALALMQLVADLSVENCLLKKKLREIGGMVLAPPQVHGHAECE